MDVENKKIYFDKNRSHIFDKKSLLYEPRGDKAYQKL